MRTLNIQALLVDDNPNSLDVTQRFLSKSGEIHTECTTSGKDALEMIANSEFDVIISDYQMPEMTGLELLQEVREVNSSIPFIIFTAHSREEVAIEALNLGATRYLKKEGDAKGLYVELENMIVCAVKHQREIIRLEHLVSGAEERIKELDRDLAFSKERFRRVFDSIPEPAYYWERTTEEILLRRVNRSLVEMTGGRITAYLDEDIEDIFPDMPELVTAIRHTLTTGEKIRGEIPYKSSVLGIAGWFIWQFAETFENHVLLVMTDITYHKNTERRLKKQKEELSEFAHSMSHDLKGIMHNIIGYAEILEDDYELTFLDKIKDSVGRMEKLLSKSVALADAGLIIGDKELTDLNPILEKNAQSIIPERIEFAYDRLPFIRCDEEKVGQIFQNILTNAVEHGRPSKIEVRTEKHEDFYEILFKNNGERIEDEIRSKIFRARFSTKKEGGHGLAIVRKLVEAHGWSIRLDKTEQTCFIIRIPFSAT